MRVTFAINGDPNVPIEQSGQLASARYRGLIPAREMVRQQVDARVVTIYDLFRPNFDPAGIDLLVLHQPKHNIVDLANVIGVLLERLDAIRQQGGLVVIDVSDFKFSQGFHESLKRVVGEQKATAYHLILNELFARCSAVTAPTESLADLLRQSLRRDVPIFVIDDLVEVARGEARFRPSGTLNMLWFGMIASHAKVMQRFVRKELPPIAALMPARLHFLCEPLRADDAQKFFGAPLETLGITTEAWSLPALDRALAECDLVVLPFDMESLTAKGKSNNRALQAIYAGRYVAAHPLESYLSLGDYIGLGLSLAEVIAKALAAPDDVEDRIRHGQDYIEVRYAPAAVARRWLDICRTLATGAKAPA